MSGAAICKYYAIGLERESVNLEQKRKFLSFIALVCHFRPKIASASTSIFNWIDCNLSLTFMTAPQGLRIAEE